MNPLRLSPRRMYCVCVLVCVLLLTACSFTTNFVVINASDHPIEVRYKIKKPDDPRAIGVPTVSPATKSVSQLQQQTSWNQLSTSQYSLDRESREVVVSLPPGQALLVEQLDRAVEDANQAGTFSIEAIDLVGANGEIHLKGEQARKAFVAESKRLYAIRYR
jgi:hypothetical protein